MDQSEDDRRLIARDGLVRRSHARERCLLTGWLVRPGSEHLERVGVRNLSDAGAKLMLDGLGIVHPGTTLVVPSRQAAYEFEVVWRALPQAGIRFTRARCLQSDPTLRGALRLAA